MELTICHALIVGVFAFPITIFLGWKLGNLFAYYFVKVPQIRAKTTAASLVVFALFAFVGVTYKSDCEEEDTIARLIPVSEKVETVFASVCPCGNNGNQLATKK